MRFPHSMAWVVLAAGAFWTTPRRGTAEVLDAHLRIDPPRPYVYQPVTMILEVTTTPGSQLRNISLGNVIDRAPLEMGALSTEASIRLRRGGKEVEQHRYRAKGWGTAPINTLLRPELSLTQVERRSSGFFTRWTTHPIRLGLPETPLEIRALPTGNRPEDFSGAVGTFHLTGKLEPALAMPGDLVTLTVEVTGQGHLVDALPSLPAPPEGLFKQYNPEVQRLDPQHLRIHRVIIPQSTQAVTVGRAVLSFFDPVAEEYRVARTPPLGLTFTERNDTTPTVRHLPPPTPDPTGVSPVSRDFQRETMRVLPYAAGLLAALLIAAALRDKGVRLALPISLLSLVLVTILTHRVLVRQTPGWQATGDFPLRVAPDIQARVIRSIPSGSLLTPLNEWDEWVRVDTQGRRGWTLKDRIAPATREAPDEPGR